MKPYETLFFTEPGIENEALDALIGKVENAITKNGGQVEKIDKWGRRPLAYPVEKHTEGNYVLINHNAGGYYTVYMHMKDVYVSPGQTVVRGYKIGTMGNTGNCVPVPSSSNPYGGTHLHFGVRIGAAYGNHINPLNLFR